MHSTSKFLMTAAIPNWYVYSHYHYIRRGFHVCHVILILMLLLLYTHMCSRNIKFVVPTMLYGCETWILSEPHFFILESLNFQAELQKTHNFWQSLSMHNMHHSNISTLIGLCCPQGYSSKH